MAVSILRFILAAAILQFAMSNSLLANPQTVYMDLQKSADAVREFFDREFY